MKSRVKALILSTIILPGMGQLYLERKFRGWLLIGFSIFTVSYILFVTFSFMTIEISNDVIEGRLDLERISIAEIVTYSINTAPDYVLYLWIKTRLAVMIFLAIWIISAVEIIITSERVYE